MMKETLVKAYSEQFNAEFYSAYLYLAMSAYCERKGFKGFANWMYVQAQEEMAHGTHMYEYILERGESPLFFEVKCPETEWENFEKMFDQVLSHEQYVTSRINDIATLSMKESDHASYAFIQWYVEEQVEEESSAEDILQRVRIIGDNPQLLLDLDSELKTRTFVDPFANAAE